jgi:hypothetical protein
MSASVISGGRSAGAGTVTGARAQPTAKISAGRKLLRFNQIFQKSLVSPAVISTNPVMLPNVPMFRRADQLVA